ncbi:MAG: hypothetical protein GY811_24610 [Myxococcales bacterium]|nr:hypothetical protein [Myxococcales bacterium]
MELPATGWKYAPSADEDEDIGYVEMSLAVLFRGEELAKPDDLLALVHVTGPFPTTVSDRESADLVRTLNAEQRNQMFVGGFAAEQHECAMSERRPDRTVECLGTVRYRNISYDITAFIWFSRKHSVVAALFLTQGEFASFDDEIDTIIHSIDVM